MPSPEYYRRQAELCLRLALLQHGTSATYWLVALAKDLQAKAGEAEGDRQHALAPAFVMDKA
jgi:hypothetical protein